MNPIRKGIRGMTIIPDVNCGCKHRREHWRRALCLSLLQGWPQHVDEGLFLFAIWSFFHSNVNNRISQSLSVDLADSGLLVMAMPPGWVLTEMGGPNAQVWPIWKLNWEWNYEMYHSCPLFSICFRLPLKLAVPPWFRLWKDSRKRFSWFWSLQELLPAHTSYLYIYIMEEKYALWE